MKSIQNYKMNFNNYFKIKLKFPIVKPKNLNKLLIQIFLKTLSFLRMILNFFNKNANNNNNKLNCNRKKSPFYNNKIN